jgi:hypothetical protein
MATKIKYSGGSHFRELLEEDFKKLGVEGQKALTFARHEVTLVEDDTADAIMKFLGEEFTQVKSDTSAMVKDATADAPPATLPEDEVEGPA